MPPFLFLAAGSTGKSRPFIIRTHLIKKLCTLTCSLIVAIYRDTGASQVRQWRHILAPGADHFLSVESLACLIELAALIDLVEEGQAPLHPLSSRLGLLLAHLMIHELQAVYTKVLQPLTVNGSVRSTLVITIQILLADFHHLHHGLLLKDFAESVG